MDEYNLNCSNEISSLAGTWALSEQMQIAIQTNTICNVDKYNLYCSHGWSSLVATWASSEQMSISRRHLLASSSSCPNVATTPDDENDEDENDEDENDED